MDPFGAFGAFGIGGQNTPRIQEVYTPFQLFVQATVGLDTAGYLRRLRSSTANGTGLSECRRSAKCDAANALYHVPHGNRVHQRDLCGRRIQKNRSHGRRWCDFKHV